MKILDRIGGAWSGLKLGASAISDLTHPRAWLTNLMGGGPTVSGRDVNEETALCLSAYYACIRVIAEDVGKLPFNVYRRLQPRGKELAPENPVHKVLHDEFNPRMCACTGRELMQHWASGWGNGYAEIVRDGSNKVRALWPIHPERVEPKLRGGGNELKGYSVAHLARETIGLGLASQDFGAAFFGNDTTMGIILSHPNTLDDKQRARLQAGLQKARGRGKDAFKMMVTEGGTKVERVGIPPQDAQMLQTRQFQVEEIARWFRMPPHKIQHLERATFSNIEHQGLEYVGDALMPWLVRWEQEVHRKLFVPEARTTLFAEHVVNALLRGDFKARTEGYNKAIFTGWMSINDARTLENLNPLPAKIGDVYFMQSAMSTVEDIVDPPEPPPQPTSFGSPPMPPAPEGEEERSSGGRIGGTRITGPMCAMRSRRFWRRSTEMPGARMPGSIPGTKRASSRRVPCFGRNG
jgi:phage portal protein BeeE